MNKVILTLALSTYFEYTNNENDVVCLDTITEFVKGDLILYRIGFDNDR